MDSDCNGHGTCNTPLSGGKEFLMLEWGWCAKVYQNGNFEGWEETIFEGSTNLAHNDDLSSVKINGGCTLKLYDYINLDGLLDTLTSDNWFTSAYNDQVSSVSCTCGSGEILKLSFYK